MSFKRLAGLKHPAALAVATTAVTLVARPTHCRAVNARGLRVVERDGTSWRAFPTAVESIGAAEPGRGDLVVLTCKANDTGAAIEELALAETDLEQVFLRIMAGSETIDEARPIVTVPEA